MFRYNIIITGAFSGIGKAFVRAYLKKSGNCIVAVDKKFPRQSPSSVQTECSILAALDDYRKDIGDDTTNPRVAILLLDITNEASVSELASLQHLEIVIHCAGVRGLVSSVPITQSSDVATAETMEVMTSQSMVQTFHTNTIGTFLLLRTLIPILRCGNGKVIVMGSRMGSIGYNSTGAGYAYRASKAALNAVMKSFSLDVPEVCFVTFHPGRVASNLVGEGVKEEGAITAEESVKDMVELIPRLEKEDSGRFMDRFGKDIVW